jgi:hypothetical protein
VAPASALRVVGVDWYPTLRVVLSPLGVQLLDRELARAMAKQKNKRKRKTMTEAESAEPRTVGAEKAAGMSATVLANFTRDLARFGSRADRRARNLS